MQNFHAAAAAKLPAVQAQVAAALRRHHKVVFFAHHQAMLDGVQRGALRGVEHVRIDGGTPPERRHEAVAQFQRDAGVRAALVGITVGGTALTLTAASVVVFLELYWTPGALLQAPHAPPQAPLPPPPLPSRHVHALSLSAPGTSRC